MNKLSFNEYAHQQNISEVKLELASYLVESGVDVEKLNEAMQIIAEWGWNPFASFGKGFGAGGGAALGSALGPAGMVAGAALGGAAGNLVNKGVGAVMKGARVEPIAPAYQQAVQAVDNLSKMLSAPDVQAVMANVPNGEQLQQGVGQVQQNLQGMADSIPHIDQNRNQQLDAKLQAGGGIGGKLRGADQGTWANWLGQKIQNIPALNKDMGLRRAMAQGMDAMQAWAQQNPKKAALINMGAGIAGGVAGATGASAAADAFSGSGQPAAIQNNNGEYTHRQVSNTQGFESDPSTSHSYNNGQVQTYAQPSGQQIADQPYQGHPGWQDPRQVSRTNF